ncbi:hypothetical protein ACTD5D_35760 [Nocardia takedensis]|uniref:hypothetical protein n=1 Tax=Nocardia takedensis TaxID=259390 RepID=UPI0012F6C1A5|nr:hypothetical protein [Nocardia takedensis]
MKPTPRALDTVHAVPRLAAALAAALLLAACDSGRFDSAVTETSSPAVVTTHPPACALTPFAESQPSDEKSLTAAIGKLQLPPGSCLFVVSIGNARDDPNKLHITVHLDVADSTSPNDLRPEATDIAQVIKKTQFGPRTAIVDVNNWGTPRPKYRTLLTDENFREHAWNGLPSREAEMALCKIVEPG